MDEDGKAVFRTLVPVLADDPALPKGRMVRSRRGSRKTERVVPEGKGRPARSPLDRRSHGAEKESDMTTCLNSACFFHGKGGRFPGSACRCEQESTADDCPAGRLGMSGALLTTDTSEQTTGTGPDARTEDSLEPDRPEIDVAIGILRKVRQECKANGYWHLPSMDAADAFLNGIADGRKADKPRTAEKRERK